MAEASRKKGAILREKTAICLARKRIHGAFFYFLEMFDNFYWTVDSFLCFSL